MPDQNGFVYHLISYHVLSFNNYLNAFECIIYIYRVIYNQNHISKSILRCITIFGKFCIYFYLNFQIVQFKIVFDKFEISDPSSGDCTNDTIKFSGQDAVTTKVLPTNLCGILTGHHIYLSVKDMTGNLTMTISLSSNSTQKWRILVSQFDSSQADLLAPRLIF